MSQNPIDRYHFERQISYARPIIIFLSILALLERQPSPQTRRSISFLIAWLLIAILIVEVQQLLRNRPWHLPLACDIGALAFLIYVSPSQVAVWFPYLFICYVAGTRWRIDPTLPVAGVLPLLMVAVTVIHGYIVWMRILSWVGLTGATFAAGAGLAFLGVRSRLFAAENDFLASISTTMQVDQGLAESLRLLLDDLAVVF